MDASRKIKVISKRDAMVSIDIANINLHKNWPQKESFTYLPYDVLEEAYSDPGVQYMFEQGILYIDDKQAKIDLGLEMEDQPERIINLDDTTLNRVLGPMPVNEFKAFVQKLTKEQVRQLTDYAIANEMIDYAKVQFIKQLTGTDIIKAIELEHKDKE